MAALVWWGDVAQKRGREEREEWLVAVRDVTWVLEQLLESGEIDKDEGEDVPADGPAKKKDAKSVGSAANKRKRAEEDGGDSSDDEPQPKKRGGKKRGKATAPQVPRRAARLRGADPADASGRRTRQKTAAGANAVKDNGKRPEKPKPKPLYKKSGKN
ncbi:hypothetical protein B0H14DRAFT_3484014 [Mycena olivaceomarginata]|nr:hypothetical protein B0H14DRAFT_3484014 [Mycena olivaceomarginata]